MAAFATPEEAAEHLVRAFQDSVACVSDAVFTYPAVRPVGSPQALVLDRGSDVSVGRELLLNAGHFFQVIEDEDGFVLKTGGYAYTIESELDRGELHSWQYHPAGSWCTWPHVHVRTRLGDHLPTGRVAFEQIVRWLIEEAKLPALRDDWDELLATNAADWRARRTWA